MDRKDVVKRQEAIVWKMVQGEVVLLNPDNGEYFGLNESGSSFWQKIDGLTSLGDIISAMQSEYEVESSTLAQDVEELADSLLQKGLIRIGA